MWGWEGLRLFLAGLLLGANIGVLIGILRTVSSIKKHPDKWEKYGVVSAERAALAYADGWLQGLTDSGRSVVKSSQD